MSLAATLVLYAPSADAQQASLPAALDSVRTAATCAELQGWFARTDRLFQAAARAPGTANMRAYAESTFSASPRLVVAGSDGFTFRSRAEFLSLVATAAYRPDTLFAVAATNTTVALVAPDRALYARRFIEYDAAFFARGRTAPYVVLEAGTLVREAGDWRQLERVTATGSTGPIDGSTSVVPWECR